MSDWWELPGPDGDIAVLDDTLTALGLLARETVAVHTELDGVGRTLDGGWDGVAAATFVATHADVLTAVDLVGSAQERATRVLGEYAEEWRLTRAAAERGRDDLATACDGYVAAAREGVGDLLHLLGEDLDNPVGDLLGHVVPGLEGLRGRLLGWQPPQVHPVVVPRPERDVVNESLDAVVGRIGDAWQWGISHLIDGFHGLLDAIGGAARSVVRALQQLEEQFLATVRAVQRRVRDALEDLWSLGRRVASALGDLVVSIARVVGPAALAFLEGAMRGLFALWGGLMTVVGFIADLLQALLGLGLVLSRLADPFSLFRLGQRRMADADTADDLAAVRFYTDLEYGRHVQELAGLADDSYHYSGAPDGWTRVESIAGPEGFYAVVYRDPSGATVLSFRGSQAPGSDFDSDDWAQDAMNAGDLPTAQGAWAVRTALEYQRDYGGRGATEITGHSLGGSLAATASIATGIPATTFNAAGVGAGNHTLANLAGHGAHDSEEQITNYHTPADILTQLQEHAPVYAAAGSQVQVQSTTSDPGASHSLSSFVWPASHREGAK